MQTSKDRLNRFQTLAATYLKCMKRPLTGTGKMMRKFEEIELAYHCSDVATLRSLYVSLKYSWPEFWTPHYQKHIQLVLLCQYLLLKNPKEKSAARWRLERSLDDSHELSRRIRHLIGPPAQP